MKSRFLFLAILLLLCINATAQRWMRPFVNYYTIVADLDPYFDSIVQSGDTTVFSEGSEYSNYQKWKREFGAAIAPHGDFHTLALQEYNGAQASNNVSPSNARFTDPWKELGPNSNYSPGNYIGIGPTEFLVFHPTIQNLMLCGSLRGGIFSSTDGGLNWSNAGTDNLNGRTGAGSAAFDNTNGSTWYFTSAGQVPNGSDPTAVGLLGGVYRTNNAGALWEKIWDPNSQPNDIPYRDWTVLRKISSDQNYPGTDLWLGTNNGLYHSTNCNATPASSVVWTNVLPSNLDVTDFELRPGTSGPQGIYAAVCDGITRSIQYSYDHGQTWNSISGTPTAITNLGPLAGNITLEVSPADPNLLYVNLVITGTGNSHLFVYNLSLNLWYDFPTSLSFEEDFGSGHTFTVDPINSTIVYFGSGTSFVELNCDFNNNGFAISNFPSIPHSDCEDIIFNPFNTSELWLCHHGGLAVYLDKTILSAFSDRSTGLGVAIINQMSTSQSTPDYVLCGIDHDHSQLTISPWDPQWSPSWNSALSGDGQKPLIDPEDPNFMWISRQGTIQSHWQSRSNLSLGFASLQNPTNGNYCDFATFGALNPKSTNKLYRIGRANPAFSLNLCDEVFLSNDRGISNTVISDFNTFIATATGIPNLLYEVLSIHLSEANPDYMIANIRCFPNNLPQFNILCRTKFATQNPSQIINSWEILPICRHDDGYITDVHFDLDNPEIVFVGFCNSTSSSTSTIGTGSVFRYDYSLITPGNYMQICHPIWSRDISYNLPNTGYGDFALEKGSDGGIYISTSLGLFFMNNKSIADQTYWQKVGPNLPNCKANAIEINYKINRIRVATNGRGVWEHPLVCPDPSNPNIVESSTYTSDQFTEAFNDINSTSTINPGLNVTYRAGNEIILSDGFIAKEGSEFHAFIHPCDYGIPNSFRTTPQSAISEKQNESNSNDSFFKVYPNPNNGSFSIVFDEGFLSSGTVVISILDLSGRIVYSESKEVVELEERPLSISGLSAGVYFIKVNSQSDQGFQRIIVTN